MAELGPFVPDTIGQDGTIPKTVTVKPVTVRLEKASHWENGVLVSTPGLRQYEPAIRFTHQADEMLQNWAKGMVLKPAVHGPKSKPKYSVALTKAEVKVERELAIKRLKSSQLYLESPDSEAAKKAEAALMYSEILLEKDPSNVLVAQFQPLLASMAVRGGGGGGGEGAIYIYVLRK